jgi:adenine phosphoribosyltransferase
VSAQLELVKQHIRDVQDFPKPGILFKDITPILTNPDAFNACLDLMVKPVEGKPFDVIVGMESRGFIFGAALAARLRKGFVPVRKPGKLPWAKHRVEYELEYGTDALEMHRDALKPGEKVLIVDDLLATGGTAAATAELVKRVGGEVVAMSFVIELTFLPGRSRLAPIETFSLLQY